MVAAFWEKSVKKRRTKGIFFNVMENGTKKRKLRCCKKKKRNVKKGK
jgi:hypothetical protein